MLINAAIILVFSSIAIVNIDAKSCVATGKNRYLCTDDPAKARAHKWEHEPDNSLDFESLDLGEEQEIEGTQEEKDAVSKVITDMKNYFATEVLVKGEYDSVIGRCKNHQKLCAFWTSVGECENNRGFMLSNCAAACRMCMALLSKK